MVVLVVENKPRTAVTPSTARPRTCPGHFVRPNLEQSAMHPAQHYAAMPIQPFDMRATFTDEQRRVSYAVYFLGVLEASAASGVESTAPSQPPCASSSSLRGRALWLKGC